MTASPIKIVRILTRMNIGGPAIHASILATRMDPRRFSTCLIVGSPDVNEGDLTELALAPQTQVIRLRSLQRSIRPLADLVTWGRLLRILWAQRPQIIHTHMAKAGTLGRLAGLCYNRFGPGRRAGRRAVLIHTFHGHVLEGYFSGWTARLFLAIERWLARRTDCLIAVSETIRRELYGLGIGPAEQWRVVPVGLPLEPLAELPLPNGASTVRFGMVGRLVPIKNPSLFLRAMERLRAETPPRAVRGIVVGDGPLRRDLEAETVSRGLQELVSFSGWQRDLVSVYRGLEAACLTSWNEGTPVALIEAMAAGRAVVATQVGGVQDVLDPDGAASTPPAPGTYRVTDRGVLVRAGDLDALAGAMRRVADDAALRQRLGASARAYVRERFAAGRLVREIGSLYETLAGRPETSGVAPCAR